MVKGRICKDGWAQVEGHRMHYVRAGTSGPPVLLIHGLLGYSFSWRFTIPALAPHFRVFAVDLLGVGDSDRPRGLDCSLQVTARRLLAFMQEQASGPWAVVGSSHGGSVSMWIAALAQEFGIECRSLALVSPANPWSMHGRLLSRVLAHPLGTYFMLAAQPLYVRMRRVTFGRMYGDKRLVTRETLDGYERHLHIAGTLEYALGLMKRWTRDLDELAHVLPRIQAPSLVLWGDKDRVVRPESAHPIHQRLQSSKLVILKGTGHLPYEEAPEVFNRTLLPFLLKAA